MISFGLANAWMVKHLLDDSHQTSPTYIKSQFSMGLLSNYNFFHMQHRTKIFYIYMNYTHAYLYVTLHVSQLCTFLKAVFLRNPQLNCRVSYLKWCVYKQPEIASQAHSSFSPSSEDFPITVMSSSLPHT